MSLEARLIALVLLVLALAGVGHWIDMRGYKRAKAEDAALAAQQAERMRELQRAAELRYTVQAETRDRFIVTTVKEIRHDTENLAACVLTPAARQRLLDAAACADSASACGASEPLRSAP